MNEPNRGDWTSASSAAADLLCPGRYLAQKGIPEPPASPEADFGKRVHAALCKGSPAGLEPDEEESYTTCASKHTEAKQRFFAAVAEKTATVREQRLWIGFNGLRHSGQFDVLDRYGTRALLTDYKSLPGNVQESESNQQLRDLAVLYWANSIMLEEIGTTIAQPGREVAICLYRTDDLLRSRLELIARVTASHRPDAPRKAGSLQCAYCRAKRQCPEYAEWHQTQCGPLVLAGTDPRAMLAWTPDQWGRFLEVADAVSDYIKEGKSMAKELLTANPKAVAGWQLKPGANRSKITNAQEAFARFEAKGGNLDAFMQCIAVEKGKLESALAKATGKKGKELAVELGQVLDGIVEISQNAPSLERTKR